MRVKNNKVRIISLILILVMLVSTLLTGITAFASTGSSGHNVICKPNPNRHSSYTTHSGKKGFASTTYGFRIKAFDVNEFSGGNYEYFTVSKSGNVDKVSLMQNVLHARDYANVDSWTYITPMNLSRVYSFYVGGHEFTTQTIGTNSPEMGTLKSILGISSVGDYANWDRAFQAYNKFGVGHEDDDELAKFFGITPGHYYFYVVEGLMAMYDPEAKTSGTDYSEKFIFTTYQDYVYDPEAKNVMSCHTEIDKAADRGLSNPDYYINQGSIAPFGLGYTDGQPIKTGFGVYGDINGTVSEPFSLNIALEYKGLPNTTDGEYKSATSLIKQEGEKYSYWDISKNAWVESADKDEILQTSKKGVETDGLYAVVFEDYYCIAHELNDVSAAKLIQTGDANTKNFNLIWGNQQVTSGNVNVGYSVKPTILSGAADTQAIMNYFLVGLGDGTTEKPPLNSKISNTNYTALEILEACIDNVNRAYSRTDTDAVGGVYGTPEVKLKKGKRLGTSIEFIVRGSEVESHKVTVNVASDGSVTSSETWNDKYSSAGNTTATIDSSAVCFVTVPNKFRNDEGVVNALKLLGDRDANTVLTMTKTALGEANTRVSQVAHGITVGLGCEPDLDGYTVYEIIVAGEQVTGGVELPSYMLNRYFQNIIQKSSNPEVKYQVNKDFTIIKEDYTGETTCSRCATVVKPTTAPAVKEDYELTWVDVSKDTPHTDYDNALKSRYFIKMNSGVWAHADRAELTSGYSENTKSWGDPSGYIMDYGFNLIRASVDDNRAISGITYADYNSVDADNLLQIRDYFGVVPSESIKEASAKRDPLAVADKVTDTITIKSLFKRYDSENGYLAESQNHHHDEEGHWTEATETNPSVYVKDKDAVNIGYYTFPDKVVKGFRKDAEPVNKLEYTFESTVYKYQSDTLPAGQNSKIVAPAISKAIPSHATKAAEGVVDYRYATVRYNNIALNFYPETKMVSCIGGTDWNSVASKGYSPMTTMGEVKRTSNSSSLYLFKLNRNSTANAVTGVTYSDTSLGGTSVRGANKVTIPAGSDVYVDADPSGITIDLYAYALDCINATTDATFKTDASTTRNYTDVVKSGIDVDTAWNEVANKEALKSHFQTWANNVLNVENFSADFELYVGGSKKANNFSAVVGRIQRNSTITEDGVYQLQVARGVLIKNDDYSKMIAQIAADYKCTESEAVDIFEASGIYTAILNAIESCTSDFNKSGKCDLNVNWTPRLGDSSNWYDEFTNTFVVRRFTNEGNQIKDITATDKIDFGLANTSRRSTRQNANAGNNSDASWKLNVFFNPSVKGLLMDDGNFFNPGVDTSVETAKNTYTLLLNQIDVTNADFSISSSNTSDFRY